MLTVYVDGTNVANTIIVQINNATELTPKTARAAVRIAGCGYPVIARTDDRAYRLTLNSCRRLTAEEEYDAGIGD